MSTMKVRMGRGIADGTGASWQSGRDYDVDVDLAQAWVAAGIAEAVDEPDPLARLVDALHAVDVDELTDEQREALAVVLRERLHELTGGEQPPADEQPPVDPAGPEEEGGADVPEQQQPAPEQRQRPEPVKATRTPARKAVRQAPAEPAGPADK
ncbi:hypothetical protein AB0N38_33125 [Micromonospora aurantiaca]|uniref:hypothetical protein n=1 Tax=Micromonospora aurantiaca (nom. illeg.) TaxID=47850 RepID=UPI0034164D74